MSETLILVLGLVIAIGVIALIVLQLRPRAAASDPAAEQRLADLNARIQAMGEMLARAQSQLQQTVHERLDAVSQNLGQSMQSSTKHTVENIQKLNERLALIDSAQKNISDLATHVNSLNSILANKQSRGAFGQAQLEAIIADALPKGAYEFQYTLSNKTRPDCVIFMPESGPLVIDAKFPLEAVTALRAAGTDDERKLAAQRFRQDVAKHVADIAGKYLIPGETQDLALMFVPSESIYAELHDGFDDVVQKAYRSRVVIVSPSLLMLAIQVMQQILKDARMREAADQIRTEVGRMMDDLGRLRERVLKLQQHHGQTGEDLRQIMISSDKIEKRAAMIEELDFGAEDAAPSATNVIAAPLPRRLEAGE